MEQNPQIGFGSGMQRTPHATPGIRPDGDRKQASDVSLEDFLRNESQAQQGFPCRLMHFLLNQGEAILRIELPTNRIPFEHFHDEIAVKLLSLIDQQFAELLSVMRRLHK